MNMVLIFKPFFYPYFSCILPHSLKDFKEFADAIDAVKDKGVAVVVASPDDVETANKERCNYFHVKKAL